MPKSIARYLLLATLAVAARTALTQNATGTDVTPAPDVDVAAPGGLVTLEEVTVQGTRDVERSSTEVVSLLSSEDIARMGEGDVAGALAHITGLSVVGGGYVYVRGLGDRYSLALLNGSPLPSPEPLRRAVPLDLFPTDVIASSLVQKTYSANYPGEFGGGVINLTTLAVPDEPFLKFSASISGNSETTFQQGYDHYGSKYDWTGYNSGLRDTPPQLAAYLRSGQRLSAGQADEQAIAGELVGWRNAAVQKVDSIPANYSAGLTGGTTWDLGGASELGLIATAGFDNKWRTRDNLQQTPGSADLSVLNTEYRSVDTENRVVTNGLLGLGISNGANRLRWTNLYVHDTLKRTSLAEGRNYSQNADKEYRDQDTGWYERELLSTQLAGSLDLAPVTLDVRGSWSRSRRKAPFELGIGYTRSNVAGDPYGAYFINRLDGANGFARVAFSDLSEDLGSAGLNLAWRVFPGIVLSAGYDYAYTARDASRREFLIRDLGNSPDENWNLPWSQSGIFLLRPDYLLSAAVIDQYNLSLIENTEDDPEFAARLLVHGAYIQTQAQLAMGLELAVGARLERGKEVVRPVQVFTTPSASVSNRIEEDYLLPTATLTWKFGETMEHQLRAHISRTIGRPQFRELMSLAYFDPESNRTYRGNPLLEDSRFLNAELRYERYFGMEQRFSLAGFYKQIDRPIEVFLGQSDDNRAVGSFANAPQADIVGAEVELQKFISLDGMAADGGVGSLLAWFAARRLVLAGNYTWTDSRIGVKTGDKVRYYTQARQEWDAASFFTDGSRLTGQSNHLVNLQVGIENPGRLSQMTAMLSYASDRVTSRGRLNSDFPDVFESPGLKLDVVVREGFTLGGQDLELKFEARNLLGGDYREFQRSNGNTVYFNRYELGTTFGLSVSASF